MLDSSVLSHSYWCLIGFKRLQSSASVTLCLVQGLRCQSIFLSVSTSLSALGSSWVSVLQRGHLLLLPSLRDCWAHGGAARKFSAPFGELWYYVGLVLGLRYWVFEAFLFLHLIARYLVLGRKKFTTHSPVEQISVLCWCQSLGPVIFLLLPRGFPFIEAVDLYLGLGVGRVWIPSQGLVLLFYMR